MKNETGVVWAFSGLLTLLIVIGVWSTLSVSLCSADTFTTSPNHRPTTWCLEFWLNRYQTFLAGLMALVAAGITARLLMVQISEARRQSAAAAIPHLVARRADLIEADQACRLCDEAIRDLSYPDVRSLLARNRDNAAAPRWLDQPEFILYVPVFGEILVEDCAKIRIRVAALDTLARSASITERTRITLSDEATRGSIVAHNGERLVAAMRAIVTTGIERNDEAATVLAVSVAIGFLDFLDRCVSPLEGLKHRREIASELAPLTLLIDRTIAQIEARQI